MNRASADFDAIVIGAGHNGLVCASYLSKAGLRVAVFEKRNLLGGAASGEEVWPGYQISRAGYLPGIRQYVVEDLKLVGHGLRLVPIDPQNFILFPNGKHMFIFRSHEKTAKEIAKFSQRDSKAFTEFAKFCDRFATVISPLLVSTPPTMSALLEELGKDKDLGDEFLRRIFFTSCKELLNEIFESDEVKSAYCTHGVYNSTMSINEIGTSYSLVMSIARPGNFYAIGGMGRLINSIASSATSSGCQIETETSVKRIIIRGPRAAGVELADGRTFYSKVVISNVDPKLTFLKMTGPENLPKEFVQKIEHLKGQGSSFKVNLALDDLLNFKALDGSGVGPQHQAISEIAPPMSTVELAADESKWGKLPKEVPLNFYCQSASDPTVAPAGKHTLSISARYHPYHLASGNWKEMRDSIMENILDSIEGYCPNLRKIIIHKESLSPLDLEEIYSLPEGNVAHIEQSLNQMFSYRPVLGWADYETPIAGLFLCGASTYPGGGISGAPGHNASKKILQSWKSIKQDS